MKTPHLPPFVIGDAELSSATPFAASTLSFSHAAWSRASGFGERRKCIPRFFGPPYTKGFAAGLVISQIRFWVRAFIPAYVNTSRLISIVNRIRLTKGIPLCKKLHMPSFNTLIAPSR
jgi:hypothetical protein